MREPTPLEFLADAFRVAVTQGEMDVQLESEKDVIALRLQCYNLLKKLRRLEQRALKAGGRLPADVEQVLANSELVVMSVEKGSSVLRFCRPERTKSAKFMLNVLRGTESGRAIMERISRTKEEAEAAMAAQDKEIRESELRMLREMGGGVGDSGTDFSEAQARAAERLKRYGGGVGG